MSKTTDKSKALQRLKDFPEFNAAAARVAELRRKVAEVEEAASSEVEPDPTQSLVERARAFLATGRVAPLTPSERIAAAERARAEAREALPVVKAALALAEQDLDEVAAACADKIVQAAVPLHRAAMVRLAEGLAAASRALAEEAAIVGHLREQEARSFGGITTGHEKPVGLPSDIAGAANEVFRQLIREGYLIGNEEFLAGFTFHSPK